MTNTTSYFSRSADRPCRTRSRLLLLRHTEHRKVNITARMAIACAGAEQDEFACTAVLRKL